MAVFCSPGISCISNGKTSSNKYQEIEKSAYKKTAESIGCYFTFEMSLRLCFCINILFSRDFQVRFRLLVIPLHLINFNSFYSRHDFLYRSIWKSREMRCDATGRDRVSATGRFLRRCFCMAFYPNRLFIHLYRYSESLSASFSVLSSDKCVCNFTQCCTWFHTNIHKCMYKMVLIFQMSYSSRLTVVPSGELLSHAYAYM